MLNTRIRQIIKKYAEFEGHTVCEAVDGMQAVEIAKTQDFDIIILDIMMPKLDAIAALMKIREVSHIPVIILSAKTQDHDKVYGLTMWRQIS